MMPLQNTCTKVVIKPASVATDATSTGYVDCLGYDEAAIDFILDSQSSTTSKPAVMKLGEGETTTAATDITGLVGGATDGFTIPQSGTAATVCRLNVDLRGRKRYLCATFTSGDGAQIVAVTATLGKAGDSTIARSQMAGVVDV